MAPALSENSGKGMLVWRKFYRQDEWVGVEPVQINEFVSLTTIANPWLADASVDENRLAPDVRSASIPISVYDGEVMVNPVSIPELKGGVLKKLRAIGPGGDGGLEGDGLSPDKFTVNESVTDKVSISELFVDAAVVAAEDSAWNLVSSRFGSSRSLPLLTAHRSSRCLRPLPIVPHPRLRSPPIVPLVPHRCPWLPSLSPPTALSHRSGSDTAATDSGYFCRSKADQSSFDHVSWPMAEVSHRVYGAAMSII